MRRILFMVLVCLLFSIICQPAAAAHNSDYLHVVVQTPPSERSTDQTAAQSEKSLGLSGFGGLAGEGPVYRQASAPAWFPPPQERFAPLSKPIVKCKPPLPPPPCIGCILPRRLMGQWEVGAQLFYARLSGTVSYGAGLSGLEPSEISLNDDVGIPAHKYVGEYSARYQFRPRWAFHYSILPFESENSRLIERSFNFGGWTYPEGTTVRTKWQFVYQKAGLLFQPIVTPYAIVTVFNYWLFQDQRLSLKNEVCATGVGNTVDRTRQMIMSGVEFQKCIRTLPNGCTFACDNRIGLGYLDDTFVVDLQVGGQFSVPMNAGRWGYARSGYRFLDFKEDRDDLRFDTTLEGWFIEAGLIF